MTGERVEDIGLVGEQFDDLNRQFFNTRHAPHVFLQHRLQGAMLMGDGGEHVQAALNAGVQVGELRSHGDMRPDNVSEEESEQDRVHFAALEAIVLFHHAAETLLRLVLALENGAACPWLEVARIKQPGAYSGRVKEFRGRLRDDATQDRIARIFYGRRDRNSPPDDVPTEAWTASMEGVTVLLDECCAKLDGEAPLYNSAKHGLSAVPGDAAMQLGDRDAPVLSASGPSITLLEAATDSQVGRKRWRQTTHWVSPDRRLALTYVVIQQIENLWTVARHRYLRIHGSTPLAPLPVDKIYQLLNTPLEADEPGYRITVETMGIGLLYEIDTPAIEQRLEAAARRNRKRR